MKIGFFYFLIFASLHSFAQNGFVRVANQQFNIDGMAYNFLGANYWYGGLLAPYGKSGQDRLLRELNFLKSKGVKNLRVMVGAEGNSSYLFRVPANHTLQYEKGKFRDSILNGLDYLLFEMGKRNMKAVLYFTNTWEWSGGLGQYLEWNGFGEQPLPKKEGYNWDLYKNYISKFYGCEPCKVDLNKYIKYVLSRCNYINNLKYTDDPTIMAWEIINEPRPMLANVSSEFVNWVRTTTALIKSIDTNHLITTGSEGEIATDNNMSIYKQIHADKNIDYLTIHIWPKNWGWFQDDNIEASYQKITNNTKSYIDAHAKIAVSLKKPMVLEEFGLPRDKMSFNITATTFFRDKYYKAIYDMLANYQVIEGSNFWAFGGFAKPKVNQIFWKFGDDYMGDPGGEEQGLNSVFTSDKSTWKIIKEYANRK